MELFAYDLFFMGESEKERVFDCCVHGKVRFMIGNQLLSDETEWCVSASAFRFLHSLFKNHFIGSEEFLIPHCGHFMIPSDDKKTVCIAGCNAGIDFDIIHEDDLIKVQTADKNEFCVPFADYRNAVLSFADQIAAFYRSNPPRRSQDAFDKDGFGAFVTEWYSLYDRAVALNKGVPVVDPIRFDDYDCWTENEIMNVSREGISLNPFRFINFRECAYNFRKIEGGAGDCVGERDRSDLSFTFYTSPKPIMIKFLAGNRLIELISKNNPRNRFLAFGEKLLEHGWKTFDRT